MDKNKIRYELGRVHYELRNFSIAIECVEEILKTDPKHARAIQLKGKAKLGQKRYTDAFNSFILANQINPEDFLNRIWLAYTNFLIAEYKLGEDKIKYKEEMYQIIGSLENLDRMLQKNKENNKIRIYILYLLGNFYAKIPDFSIAIVKLKDCLSIKIKSPIKDYAKSLMMNIWENLIRPSWLKWWWDSPNNLKRKRVIFLLIWAAIVSLILVHPFVQPFVSNIYEDSMVNWTLYILLISLLISALVLPSIKTFKAADLEIELKASTSFEPIISPSIIEEYIKQIEKVSSELAESRDAARDLSN